MHLYTEIGWTVMTNQTERERKPDENPLLMNLLWETHIGWYVGVQRPRKETQEGHGSVWKFTCCGGRGAGPTSGVWTGRRQRRASGGDAASEEETAIMGATKPVGTGRRHLLQMPRHLLEPHRRRRPMPRTGVTLYTVFLQLYTKYEHKQIMRTLDMCGSIRQEVKQNE